MRETRGNIGDVILPSLTISCSTPPPADLLTDIPQVTPLPHHGEPSALTLLHFKPAGHTLGQGLKNSRALESSLHRLGLGTDSDLVKEGRLPGGPYLLSLLLYAMGSCGIRKQWNLSSLWIDPNIESFLS